METILVCLAWSIFFMNTCNANPGSQEELFTITEETIYEQSDTLLNNIQDKIYNAFFQGKMSKSDKGLVALEQALLNSTDKSNSMIIYWYSYACYYHAIYFMTENDNKKSEQILSKGIQKMKEITSKNSEHLALLALLESFSAQFASLIEAPFISNRVRQNAEKALQLDSLNLRAYFVLGSNDFYTPEKYGGGKKAEAYLKKAISIKEQHVANPILPTWGKSTAYELLIRHYMRHKQYADAERYCREAVSLFPGDYRLINFPGRY